MYDVPVSYLEAFEKRHYQTASNDPALTERAREEDPVAKALLVLASAYLEAEHGDEAAARRKLAEVQALVADQQGYVAKALDQTAEQAVEYLGMGKPLPSLPGGL